MIDHKLYNSQDNYDSDSCLDDSDSGSWDTDSGYDDPESYLYWPKLNIYDPAVRDDFIAALTTPKILDHIEYTFAFDTHCNICHTITDYSTYYGDTIFFCHWCVKLIKDILDTIYEKYCIVQLCRRDINSLLYLCLPIDIIGEIIKNIIINDNAFRPIIPSSCV